MHPVSHPTALDVERPQLRLVHRDDLEAKITDAVAALDEQIGPDQFTPTREQPCPKMRPRGVYVSDVTHSGVPVVYSVDSHHDVLQWTPWYEGHLLETIKRDLWTYLNAVDPLQDEL